MTEVEKLSRLMNALERKGLDAQNAAVFVRAYLPDSEKNKAMMMVLSKVDKDPANAGYWRIVWKALQGLSLISEIPYPEAA